MDRELTQEERSRARRARYIRVAAALGVVTIALVAVSLFVTRRISSRDVTMAAVERGTVEPSVGATGKVVPRFEEVIVAPVSARIMEIYRNAGDSVSRGDLLLRLDLKETESEVEQLRDTRAQQANTVEQRRLDNETELTNIAMQIRVKEMSVSQLAAEVASERRLDSIGSGTGDRVRQAELAYRTASVELEQLKRQLVNRRRALEAALGNERLNLAIAQRNLGDRSRTLEDARLKAPHSGTLTYINTNVGTIVQQGEKIATLADLSQLKIDAEIGETNARHLANGGQAVVKTGSRSFRGRIINVTPTSQGGTVKFSVIPDGDAEPALRPGAAVDVSVVLDMLPDVLRIPLGPYYTHGPGEYTLYVDNGSGTIERRKVTLGQAGSEWVEVTAGLGEGESVAVSDMSGHTAAKYKLEK